MTIISKVVLILIIFIASFFATTNLVLAKYQCFSSGTSGFETIQECISSGCAEVNCIFETTPPSANAPVSLPNPLGTGLDKTDIPTLLGKIINSVLGIIGSLALVMFIYGGVSWMLSGGNQEQVTKGKNILIWATAGLVIIFTAYALVKFVLTTVTMTS